MQHANGSGAAACLSDDDLAAFNDGRLSTPMLESIGDHLGRCTPCLEALDRLANKGCNTIHVLRLSLQESANPSFSEDSEYLRMQDGARRLLLEARELTATGQGLPPAFGPYQLYEKLGEGGMGAVYRARHTRLNRDVAVKTLLPLAILTQKAVARFQREMAVAGGLDHENIVRATDAGEVEGTLFLVMELVDGLDLARMIRQRGALSVVDACQLLYQAAAGLQYAHEQGLVHRDLKPSNLLLSSRGVLKIADFGLARLSHDLGGSRELTISGQVMGTADYMAPEQWNASRTVDIRADIYSLGCTLYTLLTGRPPFAGLKYSSAPQKMAAHVGEPAPSVTLRRQDVPPPLVDLLERMLAKEPEARPTTPAEVMRAVESFTQGADPARLIREAMQAVAADAPVTSEHSTGAWEATRDAPADNHTTLAEKPQRSLIPRRAVLALVGLGVALTLATSLWFGLGHQRERPLEEQKAPVIAPNEHTRWQSLLTHAPGRREWAGGINSLLEFRPDTESLWISSPLQSLLRLGETDAAGYKFEIAFHQVRLVGGIGIYFGGRQADAPNVFRFQLLDLRSFQPGLVESFSLSRSIGYVRPPTPQKGDVAVDSFASHLFASLPGNKDQVLQIEVREMGLKTVRWNGELCPELVAIQANNQTNGLDGRGEFGIYCEGSSTLITEARFLQTQ